MSQAEIPGTRRAKNGDVARYLEAESPETPVEKWPLRYEWWLRSGQPSEMPNQLLTDFNP